MTQATIVTVPDDYTVRGITFLPQQFTGSIPAGDYDVLGETDVTYSDLGKPKTSRGVLLVNVATGAKWYVGVAVADWLLRTFKSTKSTAR